MLLGGLVYNISEYFFSCMDIVVCSGIREGIFSLSFKTGPVFFFKVNKSFVLGGGSLDFSGHINMDWQVVESECCAGYPGAGGEAVRRGNAQVWCWCCCLSLSVLLVDFH